LCLSVDVIMDFVSDIGLDMVESFPNWSEWALFVSWPIVGY
jgi:hypothetical protein